MERGSFLAVLAGVALFAFAAPANAVTLSCGDVISQSGTVTLDSDVVCPVGTNFGYGLRIVASDVRLDLAGHTIQGGGDRFNGILGGDATSSAPLQRVVVLNGRIQGFANGVNLAAVDSQVRRLTVSAQLKGITIAGSGGGGTDNCQSNVSNCVVRNVVEIPAGVNGTIGIEMFGDNSHAFGNTVRGGPILGIRVAGDRPRVNLNRIEGCGSGGISVSAYSTYAIVWNNTVLPCFLTGEGISVNAGSTGGNARVRLNQVTGNTTGILVRDRRAFIAQNDSSGNSRIGIDVAGPDFFGPAPNLVQQNNADNNGQYGINAASGTIDGGGNTASGNGIQNCVNVTCSP